MWICARNKTAMWMITSYLHIYGRELSESFSDIPAPPSSLATRNNACHRPSQKSPQKFPLHSLFPSSILPPRLHISAVSAGLAQR